jgi:hypothetical protein
MCRDRAGNKHTMHIFWVMYFQFSSKERFRVSCTAVPLLSHIVSATTETFTVSWKALFCFLLLEIRVPCYLPSCRNCFYLAIIFKFVTAKILHQRWKQIIIARRRIIFT